MNRAEHIAEAERLLEAAKDVARRAKETEADRKNDEYIVLDLISFSRTHAEIAQAIGVEHRCAEIETPCIRTAAGRCVHDGHDHEIDGSEYN